MDIRPEPKIINFTEIATVSKFYESFFVHFILEDHNTSTDLAIKTLYLESHDHSDQNHNLKELQNTLNLPIFECYVKNSIDYLNNLGIPYDKIYNSNTKTFRPFFVGFRKNLFVAATNVTTRCHCLDGILEVIYQTDVRFFDNFSELGIEEKNLE
jgi:hypothetical protein